MSHMGHLSYMEYRTIFDALAPRQKEWVRAKAQWEHMTLWAVVIEYPIPPVKDLTPCGCYACYGCPQCKAEKTA